MSGRLYSRTKFILISVLASCFLPAFFALPSVSLAESPTQPTMLRADESGLVFEWVLPDYSSASAQLDGSWYSQSKMGNLPLLANPGHPQVPYYSALIGLPPTGIATVQIVELEQERLLLDYPPAPAPVPVPISTLQDGTRDVAIQAETTIRADEAIYALNRFYPVETVELSEPMVVRQQRASRLTVNPVQVNPVTGEVLVARRLRFEVIFEQPASMDEASARLAAGNDDPFARIFASSLLNPASAAWTISPANQPEPTGVAQRVASNASVAKVIVSGAGLYQLDYAALAGAGVPVDTLDPATLQLSTGYPRQEVAIMVEGAGDGRFDPSDRILFYAEPQFSRYTDTDVYFISFGGTNGLRMASQNGSPDGLPAGIARRTASAEENYLYDSLHPAANGDHWYWATLDAAGKKSVTAAVSLEKPLSGTTSTLTMWFYGLTSDTYTTTVVVNGTSVGQISWSGKGIAQKSIPVSSSLLQNGTNQVVLTLTSGAVLFDALQVEYPTTQGGTAQVAFSSEVGQKKYTLGGWTDSGVKVFNITNPFTPVMVSGYQFGGGQLTLGDRTSRNADYLVVPSQGIKSPPAVQPVSLLTDPPGGADYIIITHPDFAQSIVPLAQHRADQGKRVVTVDVDAIYDTFGDGRVSAEAIKAFLQHAFETWAAPAPFYVLLVGDGHYDFKDHFGWGLPSFIPPYLAQVDPWMVPNHLAETAADNRFVTLTGDDNFPDMLIGRLPVNTPAQAATVVDKIIHYETNPFPGGWNANQLFVSDNQGVGDADFYFAADLAYNKLSEPFTGRRFYYGETNNDQPYIYTDAEKLRATFHALFNQGASIVSFHGHSSWHTWGVEEFLRWNRDPALNDVTKLTNGYRLPLVLEMTCYTGYFHHPEYPAIDESMLVKSGGGAIAVWGATGLGVTTGHQDLQTGFYNAIIDDKETNLGLAILAGKTSLSQHLDLLDTFTLFGDPALTLDFNIVPFAEHVYLPIIAK